MKTFFLGAAIALGVAAPVFATPPEQSAICIIWDNQGNQTFGEPCTIQEWDGQIAVRDARGKFGGDTFNFFVNDKNAPGKAWKVDGKIAGWDVYVDWTKKAGMWYWSNGAPALSIEENESEMYD